VKQEDRRLLRPDLHGSTLFLLASLFFVVDRLDEHDRIHPVHDLDAGELPVSSIGEFIDTPVAITGTLLGAGLPGRRHLDAPGMETCGERGAALAPGGPSTS
jgi:hypothetical protein